MSEVCKSGYTDAQHEKEMTRIEVQAKRWFIFAMILLILFVGSNIAWIIYENSFQDVVVTNDVDTGEGSANVYGVGIGDVYGEGEAND